MISFAIVVLLSWQRLAVREARINRHSEALLGTSDEARLEALDWFQSNPHSAALPGLLFVVGKPRERPKLSNLWGHVFANLCCAETEDTVGFREAWLILSAHKPPERWVLRQLQEAVGEVRRGALLWLVSQEAISKETLWRIAESETDPLRDLATFALLRVSLVVPQPDAGGRASVRLQNESPRTCFLKGGAAYYENARGELCKAGVSLYEGIYRFPPGGEIVLRIWRRGRDAIPVSTSSSSADIGLVWVPWELEAKHSIWNPYRIRRVDDTETD